MSKKNPATEATEAMVRARVLAACSLGQPNELVELSASEAAAAQAAGLIDTHPDAVAYAESLANKD